MSDDRVRQIKEWQKEEGVAMIAFTIFQGSWPYAQFVATNPSPKSKKYVDDWLNAHLAMPEYKGKIIPGFND